MKEAYHISPVVRPAVPNDAAPLAALARQLLAYESALNERAVELTPWAATASELRKQMRQANTRFFIAERSGEMIGYIKAVVYGRPLKRREAGSRRWLKGIIEEAVRQVFNFILRRPRPNAQITGGYIAGAFVREDARRAEVGRALVAAVESWFRNQGIQTSELHVLCANEGAQRFWEEIGYQPLAMGMRKRL